MAHPARATFDVNTLESQENPTPQDYGFPDKPDPAQMRAWANQERWLESFRWSGSVGAACINSDVGIPVAESWGSKDLYGFKTRKEAAAKVFMGRVEAEINRRAIEGTDKPVIYQGVITDTYKEYSDNLLMFRAKRLDPEYKDSPQHVPSGPVSVTSITINMPDGVKTPLPTSTITEADYKELPSRKKSDPTESVSNTATNQS